MNWIKLLISKLRGKHKATNPKKASVPKVIGCTLGFDGRPHLEFTGGYILWGDVDKILYSEYWPEDWKENPNCWPIDPVTKEKLRIVV